MINLLTVYDCGKPKQRYGKNNDGGYVVIPELEYDCFLSAGIGNDTSFEHVFMLFHDVKEAHVFDGTSLYKEDSIPGLVFHKLNIMGECSATAMNLHRYLTLYKNVFIKMDIEGYERQWLDALPFGLQRNIKQITMEFHGLEVSLPYVKKLLQTHTLVHFHGNNYGGIVEYKGLKLPNVFECTFLRTAGFDKFTPNKTPLPCSIDQPNNKVKPDINLNFKPFVNL